MKEVQDVVENGGRDHQTRIDGATNDPSQRIPSSVVEPIVKLVKSFISQKFGCAVVEVGIKLVNHHLIPEHREKPYGKC